MPTTSEAQHRAMEAAVHGKSTLGIPEKVGKEFVAADSEQNSPDGAGIALLSAGRVLLLKRGNGGDYPGHWCFPGGHVHIDEPFEDAARRETLEETGFAVIGAIRQIATSSAGETIFTTYARNVSPFEPILSDEHTEAKWAKPDELPEPMHPGALLTLQSGALDRIDPAKLNELEIARLMAAGELDSPQRVFNMSLFAIRITGTGTAYRSRDKQFTFRPPEHYLNDEFLARCNGLPVIYEHPEKATLDSEEYADRSIGSILLPYIQGDEVWGIAKVFDDNAVEEMSDPDKKMSTSPTVWFRNLEDNVIIELDNGKPILIEGIPSILDHVAICPYGVWDKGGEPTGVLNNSLGVADMAMTEDEMKSKMDAFEAKAKADAAEYEKKIADMQAKMDAMMPPVAAAADSEEEKKAKADAEAKAKADAEEAEAKKKADAEEEEKKAKADAAVRALTQEVATMRASLNLTDADRAKIADAQMKGDSLARAFGDSAPAPTLGESCLAYRRRLVGKFKEHSPAWKSVDMAAISDAALDVVEQQVFADAQAASRNPATVTGGLREIKRTGPGGHQISDFVGSISEFTRMHKPPVRGFGAIRKGVVQN
jgi:8-oxo-dGTP pyrophosphatase MutT (NUDIX family)